MKSRPFRNQNVLSEGDVVVGEIAEPQGNSSIWSRCESSPVDRERDGRRSGVDSKVECGEPVVRLHKWVVVSNSLAGVRCVTDASKIGVSAGVASPIVPFALVEPLVEVRTVCVDCVVDEVVVINGVVGADNGKADGAV